MTSGGAPGRDDVPRRCRADADLPAELPGESARQRDARRPGHGAAVGERAAGRGRDPARAVDRRQPQRAVHRLLRDARGGLLPRARTCAGRRRRQARAPLLRLRRPELDVRRRQRQHRVLHRPRGAAARGPPGRDRRRAAAVLHPRRHRHAPPRVDPEGCAAREPRDPLRDPSRRRARPAREPGARLDLERQPGSDRADVRQRSAERAAARRRHPLHLAGALGREPEHADHLADRRCARRRQRLLRRDAVDPGGREAERRVGARAVDRRGAAGGSDARGAGGARRARRRSEGAGGGRAARGVGLLDPDRDRRGLRRRGRRRRARPGRAPRKSTRASRRRSTACGAVRRWRRSSTARSQRPGSAPIRRAATRR